VSTTEAVIVLALVMILGGLCIASVSAEKPRVQEEAAARFLVMQMRHARQQALQRSTTVGIRFEQPEAGESDTGGSDTGERVKFRLYADGNGNGVRTRDIQDGIDQPLDHAAARGLEEDFGGVTFGIATALPPIEAGGDRLEAGADPIHVGSARMVSFGPTGRGSSGTIYVRGRGGRQFAVRVFGQTGRVRLLELRASDGQWIER
jgi:hypothetical protein